MQLSDAPEKSPVTGDRSWDPPTSSAMVKYLVVIEMHYRKLAEL